ncbi:hypothetical protein D9M68_646120 [compost metagenome]
MGLVHDHALDGPEAVVEGVARILVGTARGDGVDRLAAGRARSHQLEEVPRLAALEIKVRKEQVLEQPAPHQRLTGARRIEQVFPRGHLARLGGAGLHSPLLDRGALGQPELQGLVFSVAEAGHGERHAGTGVLAGVVVELPGQRAQVLAIDTDIEVSWQLGIGLRRIRPAQLQHPRHQRGLGAIGVEHGMKALALPGLGALRVEVQASGFLRPGTAAVVHRQLAGTPRSPLGTAQVELARRVVTGMAGHALLREDRLDVAAVGQLLSHCRAHPQHEQDKQRSKGTQRHDSIREE